MVGGLGAVYGTRCGGERDRLTAGEVFLALQQILGGIRTGQYAQGLTSTWCSKRNARHGDLP
jgi:hypothetical protein